MIDTHYDLLTIAYMTYLKKDDTYLKKISHFFHENNVSKVIANLYFMSEEEMSKELDPSYYQKNVSILEMFIKAKEILEFYLPNIDILYSIEGADFIDGEEELQKLHEAGLNCLILTWNTESKYGSGNRSNKGLTEEGKKLLRKAISFNMGIDLSHANPNTFNDMIDLIKEEREKGARVCVFASHSNSRSLCDRERNLSDEQLKDIASIKGLVGVFSNRNFIVPKEKKNICTQKEKEDMYLAHIEHVASIIGKDYVMLATDDMDFCKNIDSEYGETQIYDYQNIKDSIYKNLSKKYDMDTVDKLMYKNAEEKIFKKIRNKGEKYYVRY